MKKFELEFLDYGLGCDHNMPCCIHFDTEKAVYSMNDGIFEPSWKAQTNGYRLIKINNIFQKWIYRLFFNKF